MKIQCHIKRSGPTTVMYAGARFDFVENEHGHYVCDVPNPGAANYFTETLTGKFYSKYEEPVIVPVLTGLVDKYDAMTTKQEIIDACLADFGVTLNKKFTITNLKEQVMAASLPKELAPGTGPVPGSITAPVTDPLTGEMIDQNIDLVIVPVTGLVAETLTDDAAVDHAGDTGE